MHPIEAELIAIVKSGRDWQLEDIGGITKLVPAARSLGSTPMMPVLLHTLVSEWNDAKTADRDAHKGVLHDLLEVATTDFVLLEAVDVLEHHRPLPDDGDECCFILFLAKAATSDHSLSGLSRGAALDGAFRWAGDNRRWQLRLLDFFLGLAPGDDTEFLRRAAKIIGVAFSHWRDKELVEVLHKLSQLEAVRPEAWPAAGSVDTNLSFLGLLELYRTEVTEGRVASARIVEALDVIEHISTRLIAGPIHLARSPLGFQ